MCKFSSKSGGVPFQPLGDLTWNDPLTILRKNDVTADQAKCQSLSCLAKR